MTTCTDVYVLSQDTCTSTTLFLYPSQVHPSGPTTGVGPGGRPYNRLPHLGYEINPPGRKRILDDDEALALLLIEWSRQ